MGPWTVHTCTVHGWKSTFAVTVQWTVTAILQNQWKKKKKPQEQNSSQLISEPNHATFVFSFLLSPRTTLTPTWFYLVFLFFSMFYLVLIKYVLFIYNFYSKKKKKNNNNNNNNSNPSSIFLFFPNVCLQQLLTPTWLYLVFFFVFSYLLSPTTTLTPTWFYLVFLFFSIFYFKNIYILFLQLLEFGMT